MWWSAATSSRAASGRWGGASALAASRGQLLPGIRGAAFPRRPAPGADPFDVLGVPRGAESAEVKAAYRRAALRTHPDTRHGSAADFKRVAEAYERISSPTRAPGVGSGASGWGPGWRQRTPPAWTPPLHHFRAVGPEQADELFRRAFGGRGVDEVLREEMRRSGASHGVHSYAVREALFAELLARARAGPARPRTAEDRTPGTPGPGSAGAREAPGGEPAESRQKMTDANGTRIVRVKKHVCGPDGRWRVQVTDKPVYRI